MNCCGHSSENKDHSNHDGQKTEHRENFLSGKWFHILHWVVMIGLVAYILWK